MGPGSHEAVVVEPSLRRVFLSEDASGPNGLLYRWSAYGRRRLVSPIAEHLGPDEGALEALAVIAPDGSVLPDLAYLTSAQIGRPFATDWLRVPDRHAREHLAADAVR